MEEEEEEGEGQKEEQERNLDEDFRKRWTLTNEECDDFSRKVT